MREVRSGARGEGGGRRKEDKMGSQWVGGCVGAWMGKRERKRQSESESESENQVFMKTPPTLPRRMLRKGVVLLVSLFETVRRFRAVLNWFGLVLGRCERHPPALPVHSLISINSFAKRSCESSTL